MFPFSYPATWYDDGTSNPNQNEDQTSEINILPTTSITSRFKDQGSLRKKMSMIISHHNSKSQFRISILEFKILLYTAWLTDLNSDF